MSRDKLVESSLLTVRLPRRERERERKHGCQNTTPKMLCSALSSAFGEKSTGEGSDVDNMVQYGQKKGQWKMSRNDVSNKSDHLITNREKLVSRE